MNVNEAVKRILVEHLGVDETKVTPDATLVDDLGADSLDMVELTMAFEEEFSIEIPDDEATEKLGMTVTVKEAEDFITAKLDAKG